MNEIAIAQYHQCYSLAKLVNAEMMSIKEATAKLNNMGVSENSAMMYLHCGRKGELFTSRIKEMAFFTI